MASLGTDCLAAPKVNKVSSKSKETTTTIVQGERRFEVRSHLKSSKGQTSEYQVTVRNVGKGSMFFWSNSGCRMQPYMFSARIKNKLVTKTVKYNTENTYGAGFIPNPPKKDIVIDGFYMILSGGMHELAPGEKVSQIMRVYNLPPIQNEVHFIVDIGSPERPKNGPANLCQREMPKEPLSITYK